jgi:glucose/arabinose dehydrogenase
MTGAARVRQLSIVLVTVVVIACGGEAVTPAPGSARPTSTFAPTLSAAPGGGSAAPSVRAPTFPAASSPTASAEVSVAPSVASASPTPSPAGAGSIVAPFASGLTALTFLTNAGDGSGTLYVLQQEGQIIAVAPGATQSAIPFLDISDRVSCCGEQGLLGLAFHPDFESNGRFFVDYTDVDGDSVISEFTRAADGTVDPAAERLLLQVDQPFSNHNGGMIVFGPDGYLYISFGDGGSGGDPNNNGQNTEALLGKVLRIDVNAGDPYAVPSDNPFASGDSGAREVWDWGLRNPWRLSFDRESGALFIGDVGQNMWEEIDAEPKGRGGRNYGWNVLEGAHCYVAPTCDQGGMTLPVAEYSHADGCAVIGGYVYRGSAAPAFVGRYVYADLCSGKVWSLDADAALAGTAVEGSVIGQLPFSPSAFGEDEAGELYVVDSAGAIYRFVPPA